MNKKDIEKEIEKIWPELRRKFLFPESPFPVLRIFQDAWPAMSIQQRQIRVNILFIDYYRNSVPVAPMLEAILTHGLAHHVICPWDLETHLNLFLQAEEILKNPVLSQYITDTFIDIVVDHFCFKQGWNTLLPLLRIIPKTTYEIVAYSLYQNMWNVDLGIEKSFLSVGSLNYLSNIEYLDKNNWERSIRKFCRALLSYSGELQSDRSYRGPLMGSHKLASYGIPEVQNSMERLAKETDNPRFFSEEIQAIKKGLGNSTGEANKGKMGYSIGYEIHANAYYYMAWAEKYRLPLKKSMCVKDGALYPYSHEKWEISDPFNDVDVWNSHGKFIPSLTVKWRKREGEIQVRKEKVPDCLILIDSSASMPDPFAGVSFAVLGAGCAVDSYLREGSAVSVYNFSNAPAGNRKILIGSRNRFEIYKVLCTYFGGGTALQIHELEGIVKKRQLDIFLITDMEITNLERLIDFFARHRDSRVTAVHLGEKKGVERFQKAARDFDHVAVFGINDPKDIMKIVLGQVKTYLRRNEGISRESRRLFLAL